jgi:dTMP kinase
VLTLQRGVLIALEGIDGSGKSTLAKNLSDYFTQEQVPTLLTKEPGGTLLGQQLRKILQTQPTPVAPKAEFLLFAADRAQHMQERIQPALKDMMLVLSDRMADSAVAYQGYGRGLDIQTIRDVNDWAMNGVKPDVTIYLRIDLETSLERINKRNEALTAFEQEKKDFFQRVITAFDELYKDRTDVIILDGHLSPDTLVKESTQKVIAWLKQHQLLS